MGNETATFWFVMQYLNQLLHRVPHIRGAGTNRFLSTVMNDD
jgi:hypothetical protein